ncbi:PAS domain S-box-containing protein [Desulfopila aestuarii DSM 18488]|uniref:HTH-type transcriptional regulatory protein TyrR n=2 Tax=Desulfopila aestuarii TaxID=231440 RepID=A0A1M7YCI2_9BACT|nr:PAS domain S-box-containing protein [Desulfopila aestuarii DSM 18488]
MSSTVSGRNQQNRSSDQHKPRVICMNIQDIFRFTRQIILIVDSNGFLCQFNEMAAEILPLEQNTHIGLPLSTILPPVMEPLQKCFDSGQPVRDLPLRINESHLLLDITPIIPPGGLAGAICSLHEAVASSPQTPFEQTTVQFLNRHLETIFNASSDGIWVCDGKGTVLSINAASAKLNGINPEEITGKNVNDLLEDKEFDQSVTAKVIASGRQETVMQYISRTKRFLLSTGTPSFTKEGTIDLIVINERDMTELNMLRKQVEEGQKVKEKITEELTELSLLELERNSIIAESSRMRQILQMSLKLSNLGASNILILGESGTGKGLLAKLIHKNSKRRKMPFIEINCAALPEHLLEAELFGYEKNAFTGASNRGKIGLFELANGGTLFLDEIGDMPLALQAKLLKYLDSQEIRRVGGTETIKISCATIAATNQNLSNLVKQKLFREDLFYRLNSFTLELPPLRERSEDISGLIRHYLNEFNTKYDSHKTITPNGMRLLQAYTFPGNIRELKNIIENGVVLSDTNHIDEFIKAGISGEFPTVHDSQHAQGSSEDTSNLPARLSELEKQCLQEARKQFATTREIAVALGISQPSVVRKLKKYHIH